jgi:hypothetical protein
MVALRSRVLVDEPAEQVMPEDRRTGPADLARVPVGTSLCEGSVWSMPVVASEVLGEHLIEVTVAADEHAVQPLAPKGAYDPRVREAVVVPLTAEGRPQITTMIRLFQAEREWLPWALRQLGIPELHRITSRRAST